MPKQKINYDNMILEMKGKFCSCNFKDDLISVRLPIAAWKQALLNYDDKVIRNGRVRRLIGKSIGAGVIEVKLEPIKE